MRREQHRRPALGGRPSPSGRRQSHRGGDEAVADAIGNQRHQERSNARVAADEIPRPRTSGGERVFDGRRHGIRRNSSGAATATPALFTRPSSPSAPAILSIAARAAAIVSGLVTSMVSGRSRSDHRAHASPMPVDAPVMRIRTPGVCAETTRCEPTRCEARRWDRRPSPAGRACSSPETRRRSETVQRRQSSPDRWASRCRAAFE